MRHMTKPRSWRYGLSYSGLFYMAAGIWGHNAGAESIFVAMMVGAVCICIAGIAVTYLCEN